MSKFTKIQAMHDIKINNKILIRKGTKGMILDIKDNNIPFVRFSTGKMITISSNMLLAL